MIIWHCLSNKQIQQRISGCCEPCLNICLQFVADVVSIEKTNELFRLIYDVKGRFTVHRITPEEAKVSLSFITL